MISATSSIRRKFLGGMVGSALGNAIGELAFENPDEVDLRSAIEQADVLTYTDDTAMAIGLAESIATVGDVSEQHLGGCFLRNYRSESWRGYAPGPPSVFAVVQEQKLSYRQAAARLFGGEGSFGNGAAMRIAPLGLFFYNTADLYEKAQTSAVVTHAHPVGIDGAAVLAKAVALAVRWPVQADFARNTFLQELARFAHTGEIQGKLSQLADLLARDAPPGAAVEQLGASVAVQESMPFALYAFLRHPTSIERHSQGNLPPT